MKISPTRSGGASLPSTNRKVLKRVPPSPSPAAGVYAGYGKNFQPIGSSRGTAVDKWVAENVFGAREDTTYKLSNGMVVPMSYSEAGVSNPLGAALLAVGKAAAKSAMKSGQTVGEAIGKDAVVAVEKSIAKNAPKVMKPKPPVRASYKTEAGFKKAQAAYKVKAEAWNKANPKDMITVVAKAPTSAAGKTARAIEQDMKTAAARRTPQESQAIGKGTRKGRTAKKAIELEKQSAKENSSTSVNVGSKSTVAPRPVGAKTLPKGMTQEDLAKFSSKREKFLSGKKADPKNAARRAADLEDTIKKQLGRKRLDERPGADVPTSTGERIVGSNSAVSKTAGRKAPGKRIGKAPKESARDAAISARKARLRSPEGKKAEAALDIEYAEGRLGRLNPKKGSAKKPGVRKPSAKSGNVPAKVSDGNLPVKPSTSAVMKGQRASGMREPIDLTVREVPRRGEGPRAIGAGRKAITAGDKPAPKPAAKPAAAGKKFNKGKAALITTGALGAGTIGAAMLNGFANSKANESNNGARVGKPNSNYKETMTAGKQYDKYGRRVSRAEKAKRIAYRESLRTMAPDRVEQARATEMERRKQYRKTEAVKKFGKREAIKRDENINVPVGITLDAWRRLTPAQKAEARRKYRMVKEWRKKNK